MWHHVASYVLVNVLREIPACDFTLDKSKLILQIIVTTQAATQSQLKKNDMNWRTPCVMQCVFLEQPVGNNYKIRK
jgi:hypothetical protein